MFFSVASNVLDASLVITRARVSFVEKIAGELTTQLDDLSIRRSRAWLHADNGRLDVRSRIMSAFVIL